MCEIVICDIINIIILQLTVEGIDGDGVGRKILEVNTYIDVDLPTIFSIIWVYRSILL